MTGLKPLVFILYFFFSSHFHLALPYFHRPLKQSSTLLKSFLKSAISFSVIRSQNGSFLFMVWSGFTPTFSQTKNALAHATYLSSDKFLIGIHFSTLFTSFTYLVIKVMSLLRRVGISPFTPSCVISIRRRWLGFSIWSSGVSPG